MTQVSTTGRTLAGRTLFITGASRGIGLAIALRAARDGANVVIAAKTVEPHPKLEGTIHSAARDVVAMGGNALPLALDVRDAEAIETAVETARRHFGGIDICINNASAINLGDTRQVDARRFDLMHAVNARAAYLVSRACIPWLLHSQNPHILMLSPPLDMRPEWFAPHLPYSLSKFGMSMVALGLAEEFRNAGIACNALWPATTIATAAVRHAFGGESALQGTRKPAIVADAAHEVLCSDARAMTGRFLLDEDVLRTAGVRDFDTYQYAPGATLTPDLFVAAR
jgi:citronellol/citronellal dehydrogenase